MLQLSENTGAFSFIDKTATIGEGTKIWHFSILLAEVVVGRNCNIGSRVEIGHGSVIGDNTRISSGVFLPSNSQIGKNVFIAPNVTFTDDRYPRANNPSYYAQPPILEDGCSVGAGSVVLPGVRIGAGALVGAGSIVTRDVPPKGHVRGEPARARTIPAVHHEEHHELAAPMLIEHYKRTGQRTLPR
jgi:acetyltransferase-like isoleucine patch superfamily enzyme